MRSSTGGIRGKMAPTERAVSLLVLKKLCSILFYIVSPENLAQKKCYYIQPGRITGYQSDVYLPAQ
jgi:hypothetical protein